MIIILFVLVFLFLILMIFFSAPYRTNRTIKTLETYQRYQTIKNFDFVNKGETILGNQQIASSYNSCNVRKPYFAYINCKDILYGILKSGARYIEVKIFNDKFGTKNTNPIINNGFETGEWKLCFNSKTFEEFCKGFEKSSFKTESHFIPYTQQLFIDGKCKMDYIGRLEKMNEASKIINDKTGLNIVYPKQTNLNQNYEYRKYYNEETKNIIGNYYKDDIEHFKYTF